MNSNGQVETVKQLRLDPDKLKLRELAEIEQLLGRKLGSEFAAGDLGVDVMQAMLWIELRRHDPAATFEQAGEYDLGQLAAMMGGDESVDPTSIPPSGTDASTGTVRPSNVKPRSAVSTSNSATSTT